MRDKYTVAIIGRTNRGDYGHAMDTAWLGVPNVEIIALADENEKGRFRAAERLGLSRSQTYVDYRQMLDVAKPNIVSIGPRWLDCHRAMAIAAIERGIHVYLEKPFCRDLTEADEIAHACAMRHVKLVMAHPTRYSPTLQRVRTLITEGAIGEVLELRGRGKEDHRGGGEDLWVLGTHVMDMVLTLGYTPDWCFASVLQNGRPISHADVVEGNEGIGPLAGDAVRALYGLSEGMTYSFQSYRGAGGRPSRYGLQIFGSKGIIEILEGTLPAVHILQDASWSPGRSGSEWLSVSSAGINQPEPLKDSMYRDRHRLAILDLLESIQEQREPQGGVEEARRVVEMIAAPFESARVGGPVTFPLANRTNPLLTL